MKYSAETNSSHLFVFIFLSTLLLPQAAHSELFSSVDELANLPNITRQIKAKLSESIESIERKLLNLRAIRESLGAILESDLSLSGPTQHDATSGVGVLSSTPLSDVLMNPIGAFLTLNRLTRALEGINGILLKDKENDPNQPLANYENLLEQLSGQLPTNEDVVGSARALLRLQMFYDIDVDDLSEGRLAQEVNTLQLPFRDTETLKMDARDCLELGKIAFHDDNLSLGIQWFYKSLQLLTESPAESLGTASAEEHYSMINDILDYMAFSAYKLRFLDYSIKLTRVWLNRDPENERAKENLEYYLEELASDEGSTGNLDGSEEVKIDIDNEFNGNSTSNSNQEINYNHDIQIDIESYSISDDATVRDLCRKPPPNAVARNLKCYTIQTILVKDYFLLNVKMEVLNKKPEILRFYDVITEKEATLLRNLALPRLGRSTVRAGEYLSTSDFRIAKTAWLTNPNNPVVGLIERRLSAITNLSMEYSESLQVVNYGLGGFYGPHLDSSRNTLTQAKDREEDSAPTELEHNDRFATILIYLNQVDAGGATVFPRLKVKVEPIRRSAVVWHNINDEGYSDERTLHTGCPVMLGSKWIATKWPREAPNRSARLCKIQT